MKKIEIILDDYSLKTRNEALVAALKSGNSTLVELALKLRPDIFAGGEELFKYAIQNCNFELLKQLLWESEINQNKELMEEGIRLAVSLKRVERYEVLEELISGGASVDVAISALLEQDNPSMDVIIGLLKLGGKAQFYPMHLDKNQLIAEKLFKDGFGKFVEFSRVALEQFCTSICKNDKQGVVKSLVKDRPDLIETLTEVAVEDGRLRIVKLLHNENAITTIDKKLFEKAISERHYLTVKYLVESGIHEIEFVDVINAAAFGSIKMLFFFIEQIKQQGKIPASDKFAIAIEVACIYNRKDSVVALLEAGYQCDFDANIKHAANKGHMKMLDILFKYASTLNNSSFDEAIKLAMKNNHVHTANIMRAYRQKNPQKFQ